MQRFPKLLVLSLSLASLAACGAKQKPTTAQTAPTATSGKAAAKAPEKVSARAIAADGSGVRFGAIYFDFDSDSDPPRVARPAGRDR